MNELSAQRGHEHGELPLLLLELLERAGSDVLGDDPVHGDDVDVEGVEQLREELGRRAVRVVDDDLRLRFGELSPSRDLREERVAVCGADARRLVDATDVLVRDAPQVLAEEDRLHLPLLGLVHVEGLAVEELDVADPRVER